MEWYQKSPDQIEEELATSRSEGLSQAEAGKRLAKYGPNELEKAQKKPLSEKIITQLKDPMVIILMVAAILSSFTGDLIESLMILLIVILNAALSIYQEGKAESSMEALQEMSSPEATVCRDGRTMTVKSSALVPGDLVLLETGNIVPADLRLTESTNLKIDESSFTGESVAAEKEASVTYADPKGIGDRENYAFSSTIVTYGRGAGFVTDTGSSTEIGKIASSLQYSEEEETPLQKKLGVLSRQIGIIVIGIILAIFLLGVFAGYDILTILMTAVSLGVAAIPEGLTAVVTVILSMGMNLMAKHNAIVKRLLSVETLGTTTVICSDKTGTLTQNEMTVTRVFTDNHILQVSGGGYAPRGDITQDGEKITIEDSPSLRWMISIAGLTNDAKLSQAENGEYAVIGDPTEGALLTMASKAGTSQEELNTAYPRIAEIPFDSSRKMMTTFHRRFMEEPVVSFTKGAPDIVIDRCSHALVEGKVVPFTEEMKQKAMAVNSEFSSQALRCLAYAFRSWESLPAEDQLNSDTVEREMVFTGLTGMIDPPREEARQAVEECKHAGIKTIMITGDYLETAFAIGKSLGIADDPSQAMMGSELNDKSPGEIQEIVKTTRIFARVSPENKVQIVEALKANGEITAMTGDGVNDAPAIKKADIGIAMGITGTDVAKNTANVILTDDNFATIVSAVEEGRTIYANIKKSVNFLLSCNIGEVIVIAVAMIVDAALVFSGSGRRFPTPLSPVMLLWLNLVTDSFPALALGMEPGEAGVMDQPPRDPAEPIIDPAMRSSIIVQSLAIGLTTLAAFSIGYFYYGYAMPASMKLAQGQTMAFATLIVSELARAMAARSSTHTLREIGIFSNRTMNRSILIGLALLMASLYLPGLSDFFEVTFMTRQWIPCLLLAFIPFTAAEVHQAIAERLAKKKVA